MQKKYSKEGSIGFRKKFPNKSVSTIQQKAIRMKIKFQRNDLWTKEEIRFLKKTYKNKGLSGFKKKYSKRTSKSVYMKALKLGLKRDRTKCFCSLTTRIHMSESRKGRKFTKKHRHKISISHKKLWLNKEYRRKKIKDFNLRPNLFERDIEHYLNSKIWKYVGNGKVFLNGRCPDFINCNGKKQVILANGIYWHSIKKTRTKKQAEWIEQKPYNEFGYKVFFIWEDEWKPLTINEKENFINNLVGR